MNPRLIEQVERIKVSPDDGTGRTIALDEIHRCSSPAQGFNPQIAGTCIEIDDSRLLDQVSNLRAIEDR